MFPLPRLMASTPTRDQNIERTRTYTVARESMAAALRAGNTEDDLRAALLAALTEREGC